jgi:predicted dienelactone hydrolase
VQVTVWTPDDNHSKHPLIVMSHGVWGSARDFRYTGLALAKAGFIAAALTHTADNRNNRAVLSGLAPKMLEWAWFKTGSRLRPG